MYSPPIKYGDFLQKFPAEADAFQFYKEHQNLYCPFCNDRNFSYLRSSKPYLAYCGKEDKEFSILKNSTFERKGVDFRYWLYIGYLYYSKMRNNNTSRLNLKALQRDMPGSTYKSLQRINLKLKEWFNRPDVADRELLFSSLFRILK